MKARLLTAVLLMGISASAQNTASVLDALNYGVVLDDPAMKNVIVKRDITFLQDQQGSLHLDLYMPPGLKSTEKRPAIIFINAIGERPGEPKVKSWGIYTTWPSLMAAKGYIGISMEADAARIQESIKSIFDFLASKSDQYNIDKDRLGIYAASANVTGAATYLMGDKAYPGIKAAALYYGAPLGGPFRKDLPVLYIISEGDVSRNSYAGLWGEVLKNNAPWTIKMGTSLPHAFDAYSDNDEARKVIKETISFWKNYLDPVPVPSWTPSKGREVYGSIQMDRPKAYKLTKAIIAEHPKDIRALEIYADLARQENDIAEAESAYKKILQLDPKYVSALVFLATISYQQKKPTEGDGYVTEAVNTGRMTNQHYANLAFNLLTAGMDKQAAAYYEKALASGTGRGVDYYNLACAYAKINDTEKALKALDESIKHGYNSKVQFETDPDLNSLKGDERFKAMLVRLQ